MITVFLEKPNVVCIRFPSRPKIDRTMLNCSNGTEQNVTIATFNLMNFYNSPQVNLPTVSPNFYLPQSGCVVLGEIIRNNFKIPDVHSYLIIVE
jgi:hypothetical protein